MSLKSIKEVLARYGQMTPVQIGDRLRVGSSTVGSQIKVLRDKREIYVVGWVPYAGPGPGRSTPIYALGDAPNVPCPVRGKLALAKAARAAAKEAVPVKVCERTEAKRQAGMWGGLICNA